MLSRGGASHCDQKEGSENASQAHHGSCPQVAV
jgi:hypothetical protein